MKTSFGANRLHRSSTLPLDTPSRPRPPARASTMPPSVTSPLASKPSASVAQGAPIKHPGVPLGVGPAYVPSLKNTGQAGNLMIGTPTAGDNKIAAPPNATQNVLLNKPGSPFQKDAFGGTVQSNVGSAQASTTHHNGGGVFHHAAQAELSGPHASYAWQGAHSGPLGVSSAQCTAEANSFKANAQAGVSTGMKNQAYPLALTSKAETGVGVTASASHDFNPHFGAYLKGQGKASLGAYAEATAALDPKTATALLSAQAGAGATAGAYATLGGHLGRLHGSVTAGAVAGVAAQASAKIGMENGFLRHSADVTAALGVGTHIKTDAAIDLRQHVTPGVASGLRANLATASGVASPAGVVQPEKSAAEQFFSNIFGA
ncbi:hypothetical protein [Hyalangium versicolor]|uniref:hypothetical protein n=1 Tax=Hyalangium versicolor TaxID=2861190 RepID=UPI001CCB09FC|nr:hypothetical protein [Hyalangium versicolor]